jgi:hypothetical protein
MSRKTLKQDRASAKARMQAKKARVIDLVIKKGKTIREASKILKAEGFEIGASKSAVGVALKAIERDFSQIVPQERAKAYDRLQGFLDELETAKKSGQLDLRASISDSLAVMDRLSRLLGTDAPTKSISAKVNADVDPDQLVGYRRFVAETRGLDREQIEAVYKFARSLARPTVTVTNVPETSELWEDKESYMRNGKVYRLEDK